jgi:hypothetical protein
MRDRCGCQDVQFYCEDVDRYDSGGRVMLCWPRNFYAAGRLSALRESEGCLA